jgi:hypothetical protein
MFAITVFLPVRSSLYAVAPSIGSALVASLVAARARSAAPHRFVVVSAVLIAIVATLTPVYRWRNRGLIEPADLSTQSLAAMQRATQPGTPVRQIVLLDDPHAAVKLEDAFGALAPDAVHLFVSEDARISTIDDRVREYECRDDVMVFQLRGDRLVQERMRTKGSPDDTSPSHPG